MADAEIFADGLGDFAGRNILALPAERIADAIDEVVVALLILAQQIAGAEPGIAGGQDIAQGILLRCLRGSVALEAGAEFDGSFATLPSASPAWFGAQAMQKPF